MKNTIALAAALLSLATAHAKKPNIVFFITDDQFKHQENWMPDGQGKNFTPNTDSLAAQSTVLDRQYATSPVCTPSRFACLTGMYPSRSQSPHFLDRMKELDGQASVEWNTFVTKETPNLAKMLRKGGYRTGMVGKNHVVEAQGLQKPEWLAAPDDPAMLQILKTNHEKEVQALNEAGFEYTASLYYDNPDFIGVKALACHNLDWIAKGALDFFDKKDERPFFLWCAVTIPHGPGDPARSWNADPRITAMGLLDKPLDVLPPRNTIPERLKAAGIKDMSRANLLWLDDMVGALINKLKQNGQWENTVFLYFNDHGQLAKGTVYEGGVHSEAFIRHPKGFEAGARTSARVSNIDFTPTLLDIAGVKPSDDAKFDGRSFLPILEGKEKHNTEPQFYELGFVRGVYHEGYKYIALRYPPSAANMPLEKRQRILERFNKSQQRRDRPVYTEDPNAPFSHVSLIPGGGDAEHMSITKYPAFYDADQLYHLTADPNEQRNLAKDPAHAERLEKMKKLLKDHLAKMPGTFGDLKPQ